MLNLLDASVIWVAARVAMRLLRCFCGGFLLTQEKKLPTPSSQRYSDL